MGCSTTSSPATRPAVPFGAEICPLFATDCPTSTASPFVDVIGALIDDGT